MYKRQLEALGHRVEVEVEAPFERLHVGAGDERAEVAEHHAGEQVQTRVRAHERRTPVVLDRTADGGGDGWQRVVVVRDETDWDVTPDQENPMEPAGFDQELLGLKAGDEKSFVLGWPADVQSIIG